MEAQPCSAQARYKGEHKSKRETSRPPIQPVSTMILLLRNLHRGRSPAEVPTTRKKNSLQTSGPWGCEWTRAIWDAGRTTVSPAFVELKWLLARH